MVKCKNCDREISNIGSDGSKYPVWHHTEGRQKHLMRCWPEDTGQPYGLNAEPEQQYSIPVTIDGVEVGKAEDLGNGTIEVVMNEEYNKVLNIGHIKHLSINKNGLGEIHAE